MGCPEASWRRLGGSSRRLGGFLEGLRRILEVSWRRLGASWTCLGENVEKKVEGREFFGRVLKAKMEAKIIKIRVENAT